MSDKIEKILSAFKSLCVSFRYCKDIPFWKFPVIVRWNCRVKGRGKIMFGDRGGRLIIGFGNVGIYDKRFSPCILELNGRINVDGKVSFGQGARISVGPDAVLTIGDNTINTAEARIICFDSITIGENVVLGWETVIMDTDFHSVINLIDRRISTCHSPIVIGDSVWTGQKVMILKGVHLGKGSIVASCAVVTKSFNENNVLIAGNPAVVKRNNVTRY